MICNKCRQVHLRKETADLAAEVKGEKLLVRMDALVCPKCGYATVEGRSMPEYMRLAADAYRQKHSLLTSTEIRERRITLRMTQEQFASYLGTGIASIKRWELGQIQDQAMDRLIRLMTEVEEAKNNYVKVAALAAPVESIVLGASSVFFPVGTAFAPTEWQPRESWVSTIVNDWEKESTAA